MPGIPLTPPSVKSISRPTPTGVGSEWIQTDSSGLVTERWTWNGSIYVSDTKLHSLPVDDMNYVSGGKFWSIGKNPDYGLYLLALTWSPVLTPGTYSTFNYWALTLSEFLADNSSPDYSTELRTDTVAPTINTNISLRKTLNRTVANGVVKIRLTTYKSGTPPNISHGWIGLSYRLTTP